MIEFHCSNSDVKGLLEDYWKSDDAGNFIHTQKYLLSKYGFKCSTTLDTLVKKNGFAFINERKYLCTSCEHPHKFFSRKDFKEIFKRYSLICKKCQFEEVEENLIKAYNSSKDYILKFNEMYEANVNNKYYVDYQKVIEGLGFLELMYLYVILISSKPNCFGKIGAKKFPLFLHEEFYKENKFLQILFEKSLIFYTIGSTVLESIRYLEFYQNFYKKELSLENNDNLSILKDKKTDFFNIVLKPKGFSFKKYEVFLLDKIMSYNLNFSDLEGLSFFLKNRRKMEILFLNNVVEYNTEFRLLRDNAIDCKFEILQENYNLKEIYGYFNSSVNSALYKLDTLADSQRKFLKNKIYSNIFKSENEKKIFEKNLPKNYRKSNLLKFIEENYELDCIWEDVPVNEFIGVFFKKLENLGKFDVL